jgi:hypothetical protein
VREIWKGITRHAILGLVGDEVASLSEGKKTVEE